MMSITSHHRGIRCQPKDLFTNDILISIFDKLNVVQRKRLSRVCTHWKDLIEKTFRWVTVFSAVDDRRCVTNWQPSGWISLKFVSQKNYIRIPKTSASDILSRVASQLPNLTAIDLECCDINNRVIRTILSNCKKIERINLDSSTRLNYYSFTLMARDWARLRHVNLSCCVDVDEKSALFLIQNLTQLESLNLCGTIIEGRCLEHLNPNMKRLDISYCWRVREDGLRALSRAKCRHLEELSINNFDFDGSENCMIQVLGNFLSLKHLQMSIGPCVAHDYFIDRISNKGFSAIAQLKDLETLIIEKICILHNNTLIHIFKNCTKLKRLRLNLGWLNFCNDICFVHLGSLLPNLEELHIAYPSSLTSTGLSSISNLKRLKSLSIVNSNIDNDVFKYIERLDNLTTVNLDDCRKITLRGLTMLKKIATRRGGHIIRASLLGTGIITKRVKAQKDFPPNLIAQISNYRETKFHLQLPPVIDM